MKTLLWTSAPRHLSDMYSVRRATARRPVQLQISGKMAFIVTNERTATHAGHSGGGVMPLLLKAGPRGDSGYEV